MFHITEQLKEFIEKTFLRKGSHEEADKFCLLELVSKIAGEDVRTDLPDCTCTVLAMFCRRMNDRVGSEDRQKLKVLIPHLIGSRSTPEVEQRRAHLFADYAVRKWTPRALRVSGFEAEAAKLEALASIVDDQTAIAAIYVAAEITARTATNISANAAVRAAATTTQVVSNIAYAGAYSSYAAEAAAYANIPIEEQIEVVLEAIKITE